MSRPDRQSAQQEVVNLSDTAMDQLTPINQLLVWGLRRWRLAMTSREDGLTAIRPAFEEAHCPQVALAMDELLNLLSVCAHRSIVVCCPGHGKLTYDELLIMELLRVSQAGRDALTRSVASSFVPPRLSAPFCRSVDLLTEALRRAGYNLAMRPHLSLVSSSTKEA